MRTSTLGRVVKPVNAVDSDPFHNVTSSRFASDEMGCVAPAFLPSSVAGHNNNFPVSNPTAGGTNDKEEVRKNEIGQQTCNSNEQNEHRPTSRQEFSSNGITDSPKQPGKAPASPQPSGYGLPPVSALSLLMICEQTPRSPR